MSSREAEGSPGLVSPIKGRLFPLKKALARLAFLNKQLEYQPKGQIQRDLVAGQDLTEMKTVFLLSSRGGGLIDEVFNCFSFRVTSQDSDFPGKDRRKLKGCFSPVLIPCCHCPLLHRLATWDKAQGHSSMKLCSAKRPSST